ncbi:MAG: homoserine dehydrogenase [Acidimicrobiales bacterium]|nr:homoserine dehydrogenase [Acidimicrobiales bacterium]
MPVGVGLLGCGNVGSALVSLIGKGDLKKMLEIKAIAVNDLTKKRPEFVHLDLLSNDAESVINRDDVQIVVELIGGIEPAKSLILKALKAGKSVISGNKELLANHGMELASAANEGGVDLLYEAAVAGAIPLVRLLRESLAGEEIIRVLGIVNGTTNYILTQMTEFGIDFKSALQQAQDLGYAERNPEADVEGMDAAAKASILASIAFGADVVFDDVFREGITGLESYDISYATKMGYVVKLLAIIEMVEGPGSSTGSGGSRKLSVRVHPALVSADHPLASVRGPFNAIFIEGEAAGDLMLYGKGAGGAPTASAVLGDVLDAAHNISFAASSRTLERETVAFAPINDITTRYYLALDVVDEPGVLAEVAKIFGVNKVSISSMEQVETNEGARLVFFTHVALEKNLQATKRDLGNLSVVKKVGSIIRILDGGQE